MTVIDIQKQLQIESEESYLTPSLKIGIIPELFRLNIYHKLYVSTLLQADFKNIINKHTI